VATHPLVRQLVDDYLAAVDAAVPGRVVGLYLVGSVALQDFRPRASDVDFVAITDTPVSAAELAALERAHATLAARHRRPHFDGAYVTWRDLAGDPADAAPGAGSHEGRLHRREGGCDPVTWHTLASHGVAVRGPDRAELSVWTDRPALAAWTRQNLDDYWRVWLRRSSRLLSWPGLACVHPWGPAWGVLGVSRMHYTLATGAIISKHGAGLYARHAFDPRWRRIVDECLRLREGGPGRGHYGSPFARRREALAFVAMAIAEAHRIR
jgi:hypothetical protein